MQLVFFLLLPSALLSLTLLDVCDPHRATVSNWERQDNLAAVLTTWLVVGCFGLLAGWLEKVRCHFAQGDGRLHPHAPWWLRYRFTATLWLWCGLQPFCLVASNWTAWTLYLGGDAAHRSFQILMMLVPSAVLLGVMEWISCASQFRRMHSPSHPANLLRTFHRVCQNATHTWLLPLGLPIAIASLGELGNQALLAFPPMGMTGPVVCAIATSLITTLMIPHVFVRLIQAQPADIAIERQVAQVWQLGSKSVPRILQWPTGCRVANAAVVGMMSQGRKLLLTDALLQRLTDRELALVVLHELAHCQRYHAWVRMLPTVVTVMVMLALMNILEGVFLSAACVGMLVVFLSSLIGVCWWTEFDADRQAIIMARGLECYRVDSTSPLPMADTTAIAIDLANALRKIYGSGNHSKKGWLHPSCHQRIARLTPFLLV